jgi:hypothetical protein
MQRNNKINYLYGAEQEKRYNYRGDAVVPARRRL